MKYFPPFDNPLSEIEQEIFREFLRQAQLSYNLAYVLTATSAIILMAGVGLLYLDKIPEASVTAAGGLLGSLTSVQYAKEAKDELRDILDKWQQSRLSVKIVLDEFRR